ncbi:helix-turn-helix domain-containing protein [Lentibacillus lipolyticus]|nr:helix-turn-helix domain-containing protein [Lentibacillus lipolyticus]
MEIGEKLKEAREAKKLSLDRLQETTKIQKRYLEAIEQGNFDILPGKFYARAFIKEYASAVGLDAKELLEEHKEEIPQTEEENTSQYTYLHRSRKDNSPAKRASIFSLIPTVIVVLLIISILAVFWFFAQDNQTENSTEPEEPQEDNAIIRDSGSGDEGNGQDQDENGTETDESDSNVEDPGQKDEKNDSSDDKKIDNLQPKLVVEETGSGLPPESTLTLKNASDDVTATANVTGDSWLTVETGDGETLYSDMVSADDDSIEFDLTNIDRVWFNIGDTSNLTITIDGVSLAYPIDPKDEVYQRLWVNIDRTEETSE